MNAPARLLTAAQLAKLARPFVGAKLHPKRDPSSKYGGYLPPASAIDICRIGAIYSNADVRSVTSEGVDIFFYQGCDSIPWSAIRSMTIASLDAEGERTGETKYHNASFAFAGQRVGHGRAA